MSVKTKLEEIYEQLVHLSSDELTQLRTWLDEQIDEGEDQSEEMTEADLRETLRGYEAYYRMSSEEFVRRYDARDPEVLKFDQAEFWRSFYSLWEQKRDETSAQEA